MFKKSIFIILTIQFISLKSSEPQSNINMVQLASQEKPQTCQENNKPIIFFTRVIPKPEYYQQAKEELLIFITSTLKEPGCSALTMYEPTDKDDTSLYLYEVFENKKALDEHFTQEHTKMILASCQQWLAKPIQLTRLKDLDKKS